ncbi:probable aspartic proteinase GIP2 [Ricinus communis]|uniref:Basic 7S globulin 2 small subunit, putative n=1 Tax=Ricinus communis TaxID=3988 RepID=B9RTU3_RICCO|nr:probable aspartic proteinase GIP2 [Ricinus communis]EEF45325.1 basic 7S globulin 2 precursor small subunit, putative [Ricinus communis]|eukprot:XP_002517162.1 basic 7S globulin 2 [Ricinus communis]
MASLHFLLSFLFFLYQSVHAQISSSPDSFHLPVTKDLSTLQYITRINHGALQIPTNLVIDLDGAHLWLDCASSEQVSSSLRLIPSCSIQCSMAKPGHKSCNHHSSCDIFTQNGIIQLVKTGELVEDVLAIPSVDGSNSGTNFEIENFILACAPATLLDGLASGAQGMLGLGRSKIALQSQLAARFDFHRKFATCLSSSNGVILFGNVGSDSISDPEILRSLSYSPLVTKPDGSSLEYFIEVRSIKINGKKLALGQEGIGFTKISTIVPYTTLESSIYETFIKAYLKAANSMNLIRVASVAPFGLCFSSKGIERSILGPNVPAIDLVLQSEMVKWRLHGGNSMVEVNDEAMCLGFLDGGLDPKNSIVIGGLQLEDTLLEFDLGTSMLGFSLPLLQRQTSCSNFLLESMVGSL